MKYAFFNKYVLSIFPNKLKGTCSPAYVRLRMAIFTCFEKSNQERIELSDNEASAKVASRGQQEENFHTKLNKINSIL